MPWLTFAIDNCHWQGPWQAHQTFREAGLRVPTQLNRPRRSSPWTQRVPTTAACGPCTSTSRTSRRLCAHSTLRVVSTFAHPSVTSTWLGCHVGRGLGCHVCRGQCRAAPTHHTARWLGQLMPGEAPAKLLLPKQSLWPSSSELACPQPAAPSAMPCSDYLAGFVAFVACLQG